MKEIVVLSGKGGTGKTSLVAALACLVDDKVLADCDVDAANLHLLLQPEVESEAPFISGVKARVVEEQCTGCSTCFDLCRFDAVRMNGTATILRASCEGCGVCAEFCDQEAIVLDANHCGTVYRSRTAYGPFVHARLFAGEENSGKLVAHVRRLAREAAEQAGAKYILVDGAPGIGCPVIASVSNASAVLVVTEPTLSGLHDLDRVLDLAAHFKVPAFVCINRWDLFPEKADEIAGRCKGKNVPLLGRIPFAEEVVASQLATVPLLRYSNGPAAAAVRRIWQELAARL